LGVVSLNGLVASTRILPLQSGSPDKASGTLR
jgi:hypothetical protein